jgi:hypothetical protein
MDKYRKIERVINITASGISGDSRVKIDGAYGKYHVYDADLNYLGTAQEKLPMKAKYYLTIQKLDLEEEDIVQPVLPPADSAVGQSSGSAAVTAGNANSNPNTGGYPVNAYNNPGTGR